MSHNACQQLCKLLLQRDLTNYNFLNTLLTEHTLGNVATNSNCQYSEGYKLSGNVSWRRQDLKTVMNDSASLAKS